MLLIVAGPLLAINKIYKYLTEAATVERRAHKSVNK